MREITSKDNKIFRHALSLKTKKYRDRNGEYLIEGPNLLKEALKEEIDVEAVFVRPEMTDEEAGIIEEGPELDRKTFILSNRLFDELKDTETSQGIVTVVRKRQDLYPKGKPGGNYVVLDRLQDPGNIGLGKDGDGGQHEEAKHLEQKRIHMPAARLQVVRGNLYELEEQKQRDDEPLAL